MRAATEPNPASAPAAERAPLRLDVQALRALAVVAVIGYHFWPDAVPGGFAGVDAFFVVSGFLVGGALVREASLTGRIALGAFLLRRTRRLLPAALVVAAVTAAVAMVVYSPLDLLLQGTTWTRPSVNKDAIASIVGASNIWFDLEDRPYDSAGLSPFTHFWSLAVELQFYLLMPLVALVMAAAARRGSRVLALATLGVFIALLDLMFIVDYLATGPVFFNPLVRLWEFFAGVAIAIAITHWGARLTASRWMSAVAAVGWVALATFFFVDAGVGHWPGAVTVWPVAASAAIILGDARSAPWARVVEARGVQATGDASYSLYLVHWPVLILWTASGREDLSVTSKVTALAVAVAGSAALYRWVETPWRRARITTRPEQKRFVAWTAAAVAVTLAVPLTSGLVANQQAAVLGAVSPAYVAGPLAERGETLSSYVPANVRPPLLDVSTDRPSTNEQCNTHTTTFENFPPPCVIEGPETRGPTVVIIGDSHAEQWVDALLPGAEAGRYRLVVLTADGCPLVRGVSIRKTDADCEVWRTWAATELRRVQPDLVVSSSRLAYSIDGEQVSGEVFAAGLERGLDLLGYDGDLAWIADTPTFPHDPVRCAAEHLMDLHKCAVPREDALLVEQADAVRKVVDRRGGIWVDLTDYMCDEVCPVVLDDVFLYRDDDHITTHFAYALSGVLEVHLGLNDAGPLMANPTP